MFGKFNVILIKTMSFLGIFIVLILGLKIFCFSFFNIPSASMMPGIIPGDCILVNKTIYGARLFDVFLALSEKKVKIYRLPGFTGVKRNDVVVFHAPYPKCKDSLEMDMMKYYVKRCVGLPGDSISIVKGVYKVSDSFETLGSIESQRFLGYMNARKLKLLGGIIFTLKMVL